MTAAERDGRSHPNLLAHGDHGERLSLIPAREILVPGEGLLPPDPQPRPPADLKPEERVRVRPPCPPWQPRDAQEVAALFFDPRLPQQDSRYWRLQVNIGAEPRGGSSIWLNEPESKMWGGGDGLACLSDVNIVEVEPASLVKRMPDLQRFYQCFMIRTRLLRILQAADPAAIDHRPLLLQDSAGATLSEDFHVMDVTSNVDAVDYANSVIDYVGGTEFEGRPSATMTYVSSRIVDDLDPSIQIFRQRSPYGAGRACFVADAVRRAIEAAKPKIKGLHFRPVSDIF